MRIGLVDTDSHNYPNLLLMKISAFHKGKGDIVDDKKDFIIVELREVENETRYNV